MRAWYGMGATFLLLAATVASLAQQDPRGPAQPIPYSHRQHLAMGLACHECHLNADPGDAMGLPPTSKCMSCHQAVAKDSAAIRKLAAYDHDKQEVPWVRVYKEPDYVFFSHREHLAAGAKCEDCHGPVAQRDRLFRESDILMAGCVSCHREHNASQACDYCHEKR